MELDIQEKYEDTLGYKLQTKRHLKELIETNENNHPLRIKSINDRRETLNRLNRELDAMKVLFELDIDFNTDTINQINELLKQYSDIE